ncbi:hypothetical protein [Paraburkholderia nemoris]|uniref:hypothetical protein n=1 Tax=Paraburkholderia nemoris TaxID=2793076 RepID=UPI001B1F628C|nr:hypothetical protein [Paraburkholderia nemoris]CAE6724584.1 hypothetical protein LMG22931_01895 [Paraburkholderia nemoris]
MDTTPSRIATLSRSLGRGSALVTVDLNPSAPASPPAHMTGHSKMGGHAEIFSKQLIDKDFFERIAPMAGHDHPFSLSQYLVHI